MPNSSAKPGKEKAKKKRPAVEARKEAAKKKAAKQKKSNEKSGSKGGKPAAKSAKGGAKGGKSSGSYGKQSRSFAADPVQSNSLCPVSRQCGACVNIDVAYQTQLLSKMDYVVDLFYDLADDGCDLRFIKGMEDPFHYRNKVISPFVPGRKIPGNKGSRQSKREILTGMYVAGTHKLVDTSWCLLENPLAQKIIRATKQIMLKFNVEAYDEDKGEGFMRHVVVRIGHNSGEVLVTLVTNQREFPGAKGFARELVRRVPEITTVVQNVNTRQTNVILGNEEHVIYGPGFILDTLCGLSFRISSTSFYQVSAGQTEVLYQTAIDFAKQAAADIVEAAAKEDRPITVLDAYCGTGTIGLVAASQMGNSQVIGVDSVAKAIADAKLNAKHNGITNAQFEANDAGAFLYERAAAGLKLDVLFMDPPRAGSDETFLSSAMEAAPEAIVYISCNPETQARDVAYLVKRGYRLKIIQPVDMFPHTAHVECVCLLVRDAAAVAEAEAALAAEKAALAAEEDDDD